MMELNGDQKSLDDLTNPLQKELYFLIAKFLSGGPCQKASQTLIEELEANEIIPKSVNWLGNSINQDYKTFSSKFDHINPDHLPKLLDQLIKTINAKELSSSHVASRSLLSYSTFSLVNKPIESPKKSSAFSWSKKYGQNLLLRPCRERKPTINPVQAIAERPLSGCGVGASFMRPEFYKRLGIACNTLCHLSAVYCVLFDVTGKYIFTGADDHLVKIWSAIDGRLLCTLRGTSSEISDLAVNYENTLLAVASCDKMIRVWCLRTCAPVTVLHGHSGNVTSIFFCPIPRSRSTIRYLASTSTDGSCAFWAYTDDPGEQIQFQPKPTLYLERMRPGHAQMICSSFSSGGIFMAAGSADNHVRVYHMLAQDGPERILEVEHHSDRVDSISWAHEGLRFVSGSKDGTALIWRFENSSWRYIRLHCGKNQGQAAVIFEDSKRRPRVTMVGWNTDDTLVLTAVSDFCIRVWDAKSGELIRILKEHTDEAYVIESHPINPRIICTAGHDGKLIIWDIGTTDKEVKGEKVFEYYNGLSEGQGHGAVFDCKWAPDGLSLAATDSHGHMMIFNMEADKNSKFKKLPKELFFHTDYRPITRDAITNEIVDEQTQVPPHQMPPPFLVDVDGNPYPPELQRLVPGRENVREEHLIPNVTISAGGYQEVIEGIPVRSNIDAMIQELAMQQGLSRNRAGGQQPGGPDTQGHSRGVALRRSGEVEGVRQSTGEWQTGNYGFAKRHVIPSLSFGVLESSENHRLGSVELEETWYREHLTRTSPSAAGSAYVANSLGSPLESPEGRSRRIRRLALQAAERRRQDTDHNADFSQLEGVARPNPRPQMEISVSQEGPRPRRLPVTPTRRNNNNNNAQNRRPRPVRYSVRPMRGESDVENANEDLDESSSEANVEMTSSDSSSSEDSDSDWGGTLGNSRTREQSRQKQNEGRKRSQRLNSNSSSSPEREENAREEGEPQPGPSSEITIKVEKTEPAKPSRPRKARGKVDYSGGLEEIPEQFRPCAWLAEVIPKRSPYFPQLGDHLVYYRQGHEAYIKEVETKNMYEIPKKLKKSLPYVVKPDLEPEVSVRVVAIKIELEPPRLVALKLSRTDWETQEVIHPVDNMYVKYHDVADVVDFLILRQMYDKSIRHKWNEGDRFRCLIDQWWLGTIESVEPYCKTFPNSKYLCYKVKWDSGEPERMSPWDMDIIPDDFVVPDDHTGKEGLPASDEDLRIGLYEATNVDWPPHGHQDAQCQKISNLLEQVMGLAISEAFLTPVDLNLYPEYSTVVEYPIDLSTIKARLDNRFYRRLDALKFDVKYIATDAEKFNKLDSDIVRHSRVIRDVCLEIISNPDITDVNPVYHNIMKNSKKEATEAKTSKSKSGGSRSSTRVSESANHNDRNGASSSSLRRSGTLRTAGNMRLRGKRQNSDSEDDDRSWQEQCMDLLNKLWHCKDASPFRGPVDIIEYEDYYQVIDTPMDLSTCREDLLGGNYDSIQEFHKDMQMIFANSKQYNTDKRSSIYIMTIRLQSMYECQIKSIMNKFKNKRKKSSQPQSPSKRSRQMPSRAASTNSTPRKNPARSAATKNPYVHKEVESSDEEATTNRALRTRANVKRNNQMNQNGHVLGGRVNGHSSHSSPQRNGFSPRNRGPPQSTSRPRVVKRFRISSGESMQSRNSVSPKRRILVKRTLTQVVSSSPQKRHKVPIKDEPESDEFEDSEEATMPTLNKVNVPNDEDNDDDYNISEPDSDDEDYNVSVRRSTRVKRKRRKNDDSDDGYCYETRSRGKPAKSYAEEDGTDEEDDGRFGKRRRVVSRSSPTRSRSSNAYNHNSVQPPVLRRTARILSEESNEESDVDPDAPGPSSRLMRRVSSQRSSNGTGSAKRQPIRNALEEDDDEEQQEENSEDNSSVEEEEEQEDSSDDDDDDDDNNHRKQQQSSSRTSSRSAKRGSARRAVKKHVSSDEDDYVSSPRRKSKNASSSSRRATRGNRPDYAEDSDSDRVTSVSSRGRVRRTKSFLGD